MDQKVGLSKEFKKRLFAICRNENEICFLRNAFREDDLDRVTDFLADGINADIPVFGKNLSSRDMLRMLESGDVDELIREVREFHAYLMTDEGADEYDDPELSKNVSEMIVSLNMAKEHEGAHIHLCKYLEDIVKDEEKRDIHAELNGCDV